jgi:uncharacterized membrane protein YhaH (DUF805 family)
MTALENFIFRTFDIMGRSTRGDYWWIMPALWAGILFMLYLDIQTVWGNLLDYQKPSLNPLHYGSFLLFFATLFSRFSLTIRRLHDSGRSAKWVMLPVKALWISIIILMGAFSIIATTIVNAGAPGQIEAITISTMFAFYISEDSWQVAFLMANALDGQILPLLRDTLANIPAAEVFGEMRSSLQEDGPAGENADTLLMMVILGILAAPVVMMTLFFYMMLRPSDERENGYGRPDRAMNFGNLRDGDHNPYAAYAILAQQDQPVDQAARKAEVQSLYQSRVLGRRD